MKKILPVLFALFSISRAEAAVTKFIYSTNALQPGTTIYTSSGTVQSFSASTGAIGALSIGASFSGGGFKLSNVSTPTLVNDAATKGYVDTASGDANYIQNTSSLQSGATFYVSSGTVNSLYSTIATLKNQVPILSQVKILQVLQYTTTTSSSSSTTSFCESKSTGTITPSSTSSKILVFASADTQNTTTGSCTLTIMRNGSNLVTATGLVNGIGVTSGIVYPATLMYLDSPSSTNLLGYSPGFHSNTTGSCQWGQGDTQVLILMEVNGL